MKKKIIIISISLVLLLASGLFYLNNFYLPGKVKKLVVDIIEENTGKRATLDSVKVNIFKGLVIKNLNIYEGQEKVISVKEASCIFWVWGLIQKKVIIPSISFNSASVFLERYKDGSFNLDSLFYPKDKPDSKKASQEAPVFSDAAGQPSTGFTIDIYRVSIINSTLRFRDNGSDRVFNYELDDIDLVSYLSFPDSLSFKGSARVQKSPKQNMKIDGKFKFLPLELTGNLVFRNIQAIDLSGYLAPLGVNLKEGLAGIKAHYELKEGLLSVKSQADFDSLKIGYGKINISSDFNISSEVRFDFNNNLWGYAGQARLTGADIYGVDFIDSIQSLKADVVFNNKELNSDNITGQIWGNSVKGKLNIKDFNVPVINLSLSASPELSYLSNILKEKFKLSVPLELKGNSSITANYISDSKKKDSPVLNARIDLNKASLKFNNVEIDEINGPLYLSFNRLEAKGLDLRYQGLPYKLSFALDDFIKPEVKLKVSSDGLLASADFLVEEKSVNISDFSVKYLNSQLKTAGNFNFSSFDINLIGAVNLNLKDLNKPLQKFKDRLDKIKPEGELNFKFNLSGNVKDLKSALVEINASGEEVSLYGLKAKNAAFYCRQEGGIVDIPFLNFSFYSGTVNLSGRSNIKAENLPFWLNLSMKEVNIQELKADTPVKDKDIAGIVNGSTKLNGFLNDLSKIYGFGDLSITKGKLWELNIFKGLGKLLFSSDFANIVFHEGSCNFSVENKYIWTNDLMLKSNIAYLSGKVRIGFDNSVDAALNIDIIDEFVPLTGTAKDITTAIIGQSGKFATINITGTLSEPKYKFKPIVENIFKGIADTLKSGLFKKQ